MPNFYHKADTQSDMIGLNVYYKDSRGKLCQYFVTSDLLANFGDAVQDCRGQVELEVKRNMESFANQAILALIKGVKV